MGATLPLLKLLSSEIGFNLIKIRTFIEQDYSVVDNAIWSKKQSNVLLNYFTCVTDVFESSETQKILSILEDDVRNGVFQLYVGFKDINDKAEALKIAFRPWRASAYINTVSYFENSLRPLAEKLAKIFYQSFNFSRDCKEINAYA